MTKAAQLPVKQEEILITKEGLEAIKVELDNLKNVRRKEVAQRLKEAISYGDLSENAEYEEARNEQAFVEGRILVLDQQIKHAKIISGTKKHVKVIQVGHTVVLRNKANSQKEQYIIVGSTEADPLKGKISNESPVGKSILGKGIGEKVTLAVPEGRASYEILKID
ncbi:MAG: transcription elongation factor GreA [Candidatus Abawacabacteria bacterium RBG_16_42_10]|uniref:Transcription elongation factor GreA n=1 Tax=Candidatus Abawacabacteria bacterium RBG_16_42_10 TaxID=1817814 RepID=A0A1F4XIC2_9BACT|nr:MAG: transcription elongation factor GreA [Candidatus Abawacabacteria bacterium RBG_16_42_10]